MKTSACTQKNLMGHANTCLPGRAVSPVPTCEFCCALSSENMTHHALAHNHISTNECLLGPQAADTPSTTNLPSRNCVHSGSCPGTVPGWAVHLERQCWGIQPSQRRMGEMISQQCQDQRSRRHRMPFPSLAMS